MDLLGTGAHVGGLVATANRIVASDLAHLVSCPQVSTAIYLPIPSPFILAIGGGILGYPIYRMLDDHSETIQREGTQLAMAGGIATTAGIMIGALTEDLRLVIPLVATAIFLEPVIMYRTFRPLWNHNREERSVEFFVPHIVQFFIFTGFLCYIFGQCF